MTLPELIAFASKYGTGQCRVRLHQPVVNPNGDKRVTRDIERIPLIPAGEFDVIVHTWDAGTRDDVTEHTKKIHTTIRIRGTHITDVGGSVVLYLYYAAGEDPKLSGDASAHRWLATVLPSLTPVTDGRTLLHTFDVDADGFMDRLLATYPWLHDPIVAVLRAQRDVEDGGTTTG